MDEDFELTELELAFCYHIVNQIVDADGVRAPEEARFLKATFPAGVFEKAGFVRADGHFSQRWHDACGEALLVLPGRPLEDRLRMVRTLFDAALADDAFEMEEEAVMKRAARLLGLAPEEYAAELERLVTSEVALDEPES